MHYRQHRHPTEFPVQLRTPYGIQAAKVHDVTQTGACLIGMTDIKRGDKVQMDVLSNRIDAVVLWVDGKRSGLTFRPGLTAHQLDTLLHRPNARGSMQRGSVGFHMIEMN